MIPVISLTIHENNEQVISPACVFINQIRLWGQLRSLKPSNQVYKIIKDYGPRVLIENKLRL